MPIHRIAHFNLRLERGLMEEVRAFYEEVVGLVPGPRPPLRSSGYWLYAGGRDLLHLSEEAPEDRRRTGSDLTFDHVALECSDWLEFTSRLERFNIPFSQKIVPSTGVRQIFFRDPAGNGVELNFPEGSGRTIDSNLR